MDSMIDVLNEYNRKVEELEALIDNVVSDRIDYLKKNKKQLLGIMPNSGKIYKIKDVQNFFNTSYRFSDFNTSKVYYAKVKDYSVRIDSRQYPFSHRIYLPEVPCIILDENFNPLKENIGTSSYNIEHNVYIEYLEDVDLTTPKDVATFVYVMIDKSTGFYKIGRSKNPQIREKTLQSEKPTIEMLFNYSGTNKDEKTLHQTFGNKRIRGEWFDLSGSDIQYINNYFNQ
jgi:hypothetical protein